MEHDDDLYRVRNPYAAPDYAPVIPESPVQEQTYEGELQPFKTLWTQPRYTVRRLAAEDPTRYVLLFACLSGVGNVLDRASMRDLGDQLPLLGVLLVACVIGPLSGLFTLWFGSHLIRWTGSWIGGTSSREHIKTAMAWSYVPAICAMVFWIPNLLLFGSEMFTAEMPRVASTPLMFVPLIGLGLVELVLQVWGFVLLCNMIAEVQGFRSAWKGLGNLVLSLLVVFVPLMMLIIAGVVLFIGMS